MSSEWQLYWDDIESSCEKILRYTQDMDLRAFQRDEKTFDAVSRNLEIIHEAAKSLPEDLHHRLADSEWRKMAALQAIVADARFGDKNDRLWDVVQHQIPELLHALWSADEEAMDVQRDPHRRRRGRQALHPTDIPAPGWRDIAWRVWDQLYLNNIFIVAAGVAFYGLLAIFPALAALVSIYGLIADPADVAQQLEVPGGALPSEAWALLKEQLRTLTERSSTTTLSIGVAVGLVLTLWSARAGVGALVMALNIVYGEDEKRGWIEFYLLTLLLTLGAIVFGAVALSLIVALPVLLGNIGVREGVQILVSILRWPLLALSVMFALAVIYRFGPSRSQARWEWVSWGAVAATLLWMAGSVLFSFYVRNFGAFDNTYGSVGAVIILMLWFFLTAFIILLGGALNAEMEHQTKRDTTTGKPKPMGERNAHVADTLGKRP